ncbi:hypothetical protein [Acetobacter aceti]|uniref:hypothetical protein n=1 Tax=Acetobacter aceti TaxID=435 RepID=UPI003571241D
MFWRYENGMKWQSIPAELGPWWRAVQLFIRWAKLGVRKRLFELVQKQQGVASTSCGPWEVAGDRRRDQKQNRSLLTT